MRFTLVPGGDVEVPAGQVLARCRTELVALTGVAALGDAPLTVDGHVLPSEQVAGVEPWVHGCRVVVGASPPDPVRLAADAPWHVATVDGRGAGDVAVPGTDDAVVVGLGTPDVRIAVGARAGRSGPRFTVGVVAPDHGAGTGAGARRATASRWTDVASRAAPPVVLERRGRRAARVGRRPRRWRVGDRVRAGDAVVELRVPRATARGEGGDVAHAAGQRPGGGWSPAWLTPALGSVVLAAALRSPVLLVLAATSALPALAPVASTAWRSVRTGRSAPAPAPLAGDPAAVAVRGVLAARGRLVPGGDAARPEPTWWGLATDGLAVVGDAVRGLAAARVLVGEALGGAGCTTLLLTGADPAWAWLRWPATAPGGRVRCATHEAAWPGALAAARGPDDLVVCDGIARRRTLLDRWWADEPHGRLLLLVGDAAHVPPWCRWTLTLGADGAVLDGPGGRRAARVPSAGAAWAHAHARRTAARPGPPVDDGPALPRHVALADLGVPAHRAAVERRWASARPGLRVPVGAGQGGVVEVDLVTDGPHALVAGTTGSGKSELLQSLVLALALTHPPERLVLVLVDFKGGAGLGACHGLPHVAGQLTDLDPAEAARALAGLRLELARRERLLARAGVPDVDTLRARTGAAPPRVVVVVDELRALLDDLPDVVPALLRLAAQGRSLGIHLVLATQRPAGAVTGPLRANVALRICLRVTDADDSHDVLDAPDAARLAPDTPGRALVRRGTGGPELLQAAWAPLPAGAWRRPDRTAWAPRWPADERPHRPRAHEDVVAGLVGAARQAAAGRPVPDRLWSPPLPGHVPWAAGGRGPGDALVLGVVDSPDRATREPLTWSGSGHWTVVGRAGSGRTTAARTVAAEALASGRHVHVVAPGADDAPWSAVLGPPGDRYPGTGTVVDPQDPRRLARLLARLATEPSAPGTVLVVDDVGAALRALGRLPRHGREPLVALLRTGRPGGVALTAAPSDLAGLGLTGPRVVLAVADRHDAIALGAPRSADAAPPGRGTLVPAGAAVQVAEVDAPPPAPRGRGGPAPLRLVALPRTVDRAAIAGPDLQVAGVPVGLGGDDAGPVAVDPRRGVLVVGPAGSGRTTTLVTLACGLAAAGRDVVLVGPDLGAASGLRRVGAPAELVAHGPDATTADGAPDVVVVDDVDVVARTSPATDELLAAWAARAEAGDDRAPRVVASARTDRAAAAYRGALAALRGCAAVVVLDPRTPGSADVTGTDLTDDVDVAAPGLPGRGVVVHRGRTRVVQVARDGSGAR